MSFAITNRTKQGWLTIALLNFLIAAILGVLLRFAFVEELSWMDYRNFLHAHSHVAMLGWIYMALFAMILHVFIPSENIQKRAYKRLFGLTQVSVIGMALSFPLQGYGAVSISFSTLHILCSYWFMVRIWRDLPKDFSYSRKLLRTAFLFMLLSTLGVWLMGPIMAGHLRGSSLYYMSVQFYLHFQFNGWFLFAILALFFRKLEVQSILVPVKTFQRFYWFLIASCFLTYALAVAWSKPSLPVFMLNTIGVILQFIALSFFISLIWKQRQKILSSFALLERRLLILAFLSFAAKITVQASLVVPVITEAAYTIRNYVIGFIHLILLGAVTSFLISIALNQGLLNSNKRLSVLGIVLLVLGFLSSEFLLFVQGTMLWATLGFMPYYYELLFAGSLLLPIGIFCFLLGQMPKPKSVSS